ncbi:MAG: alkene reductase [Gemmatimonadetes bacterium]|nr:alkene reductase [Gemmatimonadota bacterium]
MLLLESYRLGPLELPNRLVMAPLTRNRAPSGVPNDMMATYYAQRASAGLIVSEGTQVAALGQGYQDTPGIYSPQQRDGWRRVTDAVHAAGGRIFAQLWHVGRISHSYYHGQRPVAPSAIAPTGKAYTPEGMKPYETPHALSRDEIIMVVEQFRHAASIALAAKFDGVEIHAANGYLIDQFLQTGSNHRTDEYGGSVENRTRFLVDVATAVLGVWGAGRVGVRLSPGGGMNGIHDDDPVETFRHAARLLDEMEDIVYLHVVEAPVGSSGPDERSVCATELLRPIFRRTLISTGGYSPASAERALERHRADLVGFGRLFIANPDLPERIRNGAQLNEPDQTTFYTPGEHGYIDYPSMEPVAA